MKNSGELAGMHMLWPPYSCGRWQRINGTDIIMHNRFCSLSVTTSELARITSWQPAFAVWWRNLQKIAGKISCEIGDMVHIWKEPQVILPMHTALLSTLVLINPFSPVSTHMKLRPLPVYKLHKALELPIQNHLNTPNTRLMFLSPGIKNTLALNMLVINQPAVLQSPSTKVFHVWKFACEKFHTIIKNNCHQSCVHLKKIRCACYVSVKDITLKNFRLLGLSCPTTIIVICLACASLLENSVLATFLSRMLCHADNAHAICEVPGMQDRLWWYALKGVNCFLENM